MDQVSLFNLVLETIEVLRVRQWLGRGVFVVRLKSFEDFLRRVAEIEYERVFLSRAGAVEPSIVPMLQRRIRLLNVFAEEFSLTF